MNLIQIIPVLLLIGAAQGFLLSLVLVTLRKGNKTANRFLATLLFLFSFMMLFHSLAQLSQPVTDKPDHESFSQLIFFLFGPLFYLYTVALTDKDFHLDWKVFLHALPLLLSVVLYGVFLPKYQDVRVAGLLDIFLPWMMMIQMSIYLFLVIKCLQRHSHNIKQAHSSLEKINLNWLRFLTVGNLIIWPVAFLTEMIKGDSEAWNYVWMLISVFIYIMGYLGMRQSEIFAGRPGDLESLKESTSRKYEKSTLKPEDAETFFEKLQSIMRTEKPYLENNLTLPALAGKMRISVHHLSQIINDKARQNFFEFINSYRVEEAKRLFRDPQKQQLTIAAICYETGFNSLSSFNTLFKKLCGVTPSQYRKNQPSQE